MDLRHVIWTFVDGEWVRATSKVFSCGPEARAYMDTMALELQYVSIAIPLALETKIMVEGINRGAALLKKETQ